MTTGRPLFQATDEQRTLVGELAAVGARHEIIARRLNIDAKTLRKNFRRELREGKRDACATVAESLFRKATGDGKSAIAAAIFWLKTQGGWRETDRHELVGKDGAPLLPPAVLVNPIAADMSDEEAARCYMKFISGAAGESQ